MFRDLKEYQSLRNIYENYVYSSDRDKQFVKYLEEQDFSDKEIDNSKNSYNKALYFSKRFAGKEAFWKAVSPNKENTLHFNEIEILSNENGKPYVNLIGRTKNRVSDLEKSLNCKLNFHISISDEKPNALAFVIIFLAQLD